MALITFLKIMKLEMVSFLKVICFNIGFGEDYTLFI